MKQRCQTHSRYGSNVSDAVGKISLKISDSTDLVLALQLVTMPIPSHGSSRLTDTAKTITQKISLKTSYSMSQTLLIQT
jgi:hypothetical protein